MKPLTEVIIADDHHLLREGLKILLETTPGYKVVAEANNTQSLLEAVHANTPDVVISDYNMPTGDIISVVRDIKQHTPATKVIILTGVVSGSLYRQLLNIPVDGIFLKEGSMDEILEGLERIINGETVVSATVQEQIEMVNGVLTSREFEVMECVVKGLSNTDISKKLFISAKTVDNHRSNIFKKLGVRSAVELAEYARKHGLLSNG
ncbi:response regulator transcription factor [Oceanicoccus sp. KOV_DT_Chl]|uniref:response regulator transcription factor n=1 Tax=Oceanicoccus sp. KOV_DT_Chl TaxID=1904639 RepID=UPI000C7E2D4D|nr:response regulator transcription factor [Oceanicoccus sp. KOV_DT_Chl]